MRQRYRVERGVPRALDAIVPPDRSFGLRATAGRARPRAPVGSRDPGDIQHARIGIATPGDHGRDLAVPCRGTIAGARCREFIRARFAELHERLLAGEAAVTDELCALVAPELRRQLRRWAPRSRQDLIEDALDDTLVERVAVAHDYDPCRGDPIAWLVTIARHKLVDAGRAIGRRRQREVPLTGELTRRLHAPPSISLDELAERRVWVDSRRQRLLAVAKTAQERRFLEARLRGAPADAQAALLDAGDLPQAEQRALVNQVWERLRLRAVRSTRANAGGKAD